MIENLLYSIPPIVLLGYLSNRLYFSGARCKSKKKLTGKTVIVTGANCGIGFEAALDFAKRDAHVILACRSRQRGDEAVRKIQIKSKNNKVEVEILNLSSLNSIKDFADRIKSKCSQVNILVCNAGLSHSIYEETEDGFETDFAVNHLGHFYLTNLLLDLIKASAPSRIINVSSSGHEYIKDELDWDKVQENAKNNYEGFKGYAISKLANVLFTAELAKRLDEESGNSSNKVTVVSLHPGVVRTEIFDKMIGNFKPIKKFIASAILYLFMPIIYMTTRSCAEGAQTTIHCALDDQVESQNGKYFNNCQPCPESVQGRNMASSKKLWDTSVRLLGSRLKD